MSFEVLISDRSKEVYLLHCSLLLQQQLCRVLWDPLYRPWYAQSWLCKRANMHPSQMKCEVTDTRVLSHLALESLLPQRLGNPVGGLHEARHDLRAALMDELLHPLYGHLVILPQPQLLLHGSRNCLA